MAKSTPIPVWLILSAVLLLPTVSQAQTFTRKGNLLKNPTRVMTGTKHIAQLRTQLRNAINSKGGALERFTPAVKAVLEDPALDVKEIEVRVNGQLTRVKRGWGWFSWEAPTYQLTVNGVIGLTVADLRLAGSPNGGSTRDTLVKSYTEVTVTQLRSVNGVRWYMASSGDNWGWVPAEHVLLERTSPLTKIPGESLSVVFAFGSLMRGARFFHPDGHTYGATVTSVHNGGPFRATANRLAGHALIRLGGGAHRLEEDGSEKPTIDALSLAIRFTKKAPPFDTEVRPGDQDLLTSALAERFGDFFPAAFPTNRTETGSLPKPPIQRFLARNFDLFVPPAMKGDPHDFFADNYHPAMGFKAEGRLIWVRIVPNKLGQGSIGERIADLDAAIARNAAVFWLEVQEDADQEFEWWEEFWQRKPDPALPAKPWTRLVEIRLTGQVPVDQALLHYHPDLHGAGLTPQGIVIGLRRPVYRKSQDARALREEPEEPTTEAATEAETGTGEPTRSGMIDRSGFGDERQPPDDD